MGGGHHRPKLPMPNVMVPMQQARNERKLWYYENHNTAPIIISTEDDKYNVEHIRLRRTEATHDSGQRKHVGGICRHPVDVT